MLKRTIASIILAVHAALAILLGLVGGIYLKDNNNQKEGIFKVEVLHFPDNMLSLATDSYSYIAKS